MHLNTNNLIKTSADANKSYCVRLGLFEHLEEEDYTIREGLPQGSNVKNIELRCEQILLYFPGMPCRLVS